MNTTRTDIRNDALSNKNNDKTQTDAQKKINEGKVSTDKTAADLAEKNRINR